MPNYNNYQKGFSRIDKVIYRTAKNHNFDTALHKHKAIKHWHEVAASFVEDVKNTTQAINLEKGVLTVACLSLEVARKLKILAQRIIFALNEIIGHRVIFALNLEV
ncbi:MAG: DUF721 domain-containing protein [Candidatus Doudnabacteria bacterium]|nr:DUF721 domain-containing protein [Candidatus Doudnabacteria bacterium]